MGTNVRPLTARDKSCVMQILHNTPEFQPNEVVVAEEVIDAYLNDPIRSGYHILVAEIDSTVAGYICFGPTPLTIGTWDIYWIAVAPERQRQGIGSALMESAEEEIIQAEGRLAIIETSSMPLYKKTRRFHINQGYETVARIADFYAPGDDLLIMQKRF